MRQATRSGNLGQRRRHTLLGITGLAVFASLISLLLVRVPSNAASSVAPEVVSPAAAPESCPRTLLRRGATWASQFELAAPNPAWRTTGYDDSAWRRGRAPL